MLKEILNTRFLTHKYDVNYPRYKEKKAIESLSTKYLRTYDSYLHQHLLNFIFIESGGEFRMNSIESSRYENENENSASEDENEPESDVEGKFDQFKEEILKPSQIVKIDVNTAIYSLEEENNNSKDKELPTIENDKMFIIEEAIETRPHPTSNIIKKRTNAPKINPIWKWIGFLTEDPVFDLSDGAELVLECFCYMLSNHPDAFRKIIKVSPPPLLFTTYFYLYHSSNFFSFFSFFLSFFLSFLLTRKEPEKATLMTVLIPGRLQ